MRITGLALIFSFLGVCTQAGQAPQSPQLSAIQDQPADSAAQNLSDLQLDPKVQTELEQAMGRRDYTRAETILVGEAERDPKSLRAAKLLSLAGGVFFLDGKYMNSAIAWKKAEAIAPLDEHSRFTLSMSYIKLNRRDWARAELEKLVVSAPDKPLYLYWLARLDYDAQNYTNAIARLQKVIQMDPKMMRANDTLGLCYEYMGKPEEAIKSYNRAVDLNRVQLKPSPWPNVDLAVSLIGVNRLEDAEKNLSEALRYDPKLPQAQYQLGRLLEMQEKFNAAIDALTKASELDPQYPEPHLALARIYHRLGNRQRAEDEIARFQQLKKTHGGAPEMPTSLPN
jgi:tetratricopeptide (TPR) repeat protein